MGMLEMYVYKKAEKYLNDNPERFTPAEKQDFNNKLNNWLQGKDNSIYDEIYDFLIAENLYKGESRIETFGDYLTQKYSTDNFSTVSGMQK